MGGWTSTELLNTEFNISTFGEDENGKIYFGTIPNRTALVIGLFSQNLGFNPVFLYCCLTIDACTYKCIQNPADMLNIHQAEKLESLEAFIISIFSCAII